MPLVVVHNFLSRAFLAFTAIVTIWSLFLFIRGREIGGDFWGTLARHTTRTLSSDLA